MILVAITALLAVCNADKLDRTYLPPSSAQTAGGSPGALQAPFARTQGNQGLGGLPQGSFENDSDGVVVEAVAAGTRTNEPAFSGLGGPRNAYGSSNSKVGEAAFKEAQVNQGFGQSLPSQSFTRQQTNVGQQNQGLGGQGNFQAQSSQDANGQQAQFGQLNQGYSAQSFQGAGGNNQFGNTPGQFSNSAPEKPERPQATGDRNANIIRYDSDVNTDKFNYAFETDNGIVAEENAVSNNGIQAQGGFSYTGDDGQVYSVTYTADEGGYQPQGSHLPTPPPIPEEILKALEKNAQDEAAGIIDDGSYNSQKYNAGSGYSQSEIDSGKYNGSPSQFGSRPGLNNPSGSSASYEESAVNEQSSFGNNAPGSNSKLSYQYESQSGQLSQSEGNNFATNNAYSAANNQYQNGQQTLNKPQVPSHSFDKQVETIAQGEDQGQETTVKPGSNYAQFGISQGGNERQPFGSFNQNKHSNSFGHLNTGASFQQASGRPQFAGSSQGGISQITSQPDGNIGTNDFSGSQTSSQTQGTFSQQIPSNYNANEFSGSQTSSQIQGTFNQQRPSNYNANDFSGSQTSSQIQGTFNQQRPSNYNAAFTASNNREYLPPFNHFEQNSSPQVTTSASQYNNPVITSRPPGFPSQPSQQINFQQNTQKTGSFSSTFGQPSRFGSQTPSNRYQNVPTSAPVTRLTTPLETNQDYSTTTDSVPSSYSRVESEAQKEQLNNIQPSPVGSSSSFASSFVSNQQNFQTLPQQNNKQSSFSSNFNSYNQNRRPSAQLVSTARPSFNQQQYQDADDSYYYNQPSQPFNTPSLQNQGSRFPSAPSNQYNSNLANKQNLLIPTTTITYPKPPTVAPTVPTSSTQKDLGLHYNPQVGGVTDATASSFASETTSNTQGPSFPQRPSFGFQTNRPLRPNAQQISPQKPSEPETPERESSVFTQQYQGEIYEYKKPEMMLTTQQEKDTTSPPQFPSRLQFEPQSSESGSQSQSQPEQKPPCCKRPTGRPSVFPVNTNYPNAASEPTKEVREKPEKLVQGFNPNNYQSSNSNFAGKGANFGGPRKPPSFDAQTGYHY